MIKFIYFKSNLLYINWLLNIILITFKLWLLYQFTKGKEKYLPPLADN